MNFGLETPVFCKHKHNQASINMMQKSFFYKVKHQNMAILKSRTEHSTCKQTVSNQRIIKKISRGKCCPVSLLVSEMTAPIDTSSYCSCSVMTSSTRSHSQYRKGRRKSKREREKWSYIVSSVVQM